MKLTKLYCSSLVFLLAAAVGCSEDNSGPQPGSATGQIKGVVRDLVTGEAISQAVITTTPASQVVATDDDGAFLIRDVIPTQYSITALKNGHTPKTVTIQVIAGTIAEADFLLESKGGDWAGDSLTVLEFDGSRDYAVIMDHPDLDLSDGSFSIEAIVYPYELLDGGWHWAVNHGTGNDDLDYLLGFANGHPFFAVRSIANILKSDAKMPANTWYHMAGVVDKEGGTVSFYVNGALIQTAVLKGAGVETNGNLLIGAREAGGQDATEFFKGIIQEVRVWNRVRTAVELHETARTSLSRTEPGLIGYWHSDNHSIGILSDYSGYDRHASLIGGPTRLRILNPWK